MDLGIKDKKILVTGASRGLGRAIALMLAGEGAKVAIVARDYSSVSEVVDDMGGTEVGHYGIGLELMQDEAIDILHNNIKNNFGDIDILIHNLGGTLGVKDILATSDDYQKVWMFNMGIAVELNRLFIPKMIEKKWGRVIHISSSSAILAGASVAYSSAKAAVNNYVKGLGQNLAKDGVLVNAVMPGPFSARGGHWDKVAEQDPERYQKFISERMTIGRFGRPEDICGIVTFLCSKHASFFAGSVIPVDGGSR